MKTAEEIANHPKARLHRELVARLRDSSSVYGAEKTWDRLRLNAGLWKRIVTYGLILGGKQALLNRVAFPDCNFAEVDAALNAGNNLDRLHDLARGQASIAKDSNGHYKIGKKGLMIVRHATATSKN